MDYLGIAIIQADNRGLVVIYQVADDNPADNLVRLKKGAPAVIGPDGHAPYQFFHAALRSTLYAPRSTLHALRFFYLCNLWFI